MTKVTARTRGVSPSRNITWDDPTAASQSKADTGEVARPRLLRAIRDLGVRSAC